MSGTPAVPPVLVLGVGNPSRGDDALGPRFLERAEAVLADAVRLGQVEFLTDFQLQIEHALDLVGREQVVFVDASVRARAPFTFEPTAGVRDDSFSSHALSPSAVLHAYRAIAGEPPPAWILAIRGERFELGEPLSSAAERHLDAALHFFIERTRWGFGVKGNPGAAIDSGERPIGVDGPVRGE